MVSSSFLISLAANIKNNEQACESAGGAFINKKD
jgi:hypothetical protein